MSTTAASGSGEPPAGRDYGADKNLPRSGLLEQPVAADGPLRGPPLNRSVGPHRESHEMPRVQVLTFVLLATLGISSHAEDLELKCAGKLFIWKSGIGKGDPDEVAAVRIVKIDRTSSRVVWDTPFGERDAEVTETDDAFLASYDRPFQVDGVQVRSETFYVHRYTGEASFVYDIGRETKYGAFVGECTRTARRF